MARVLVVDDTPEIRELLRLLLTGAGHQVLLAADVDTAANLAARAHPALARDGDGRHRTAGKVMRAMVPSA